MYVCGAMYATLCCVRYATLCYVMCDCMYVCNEIVYVRCVALCMYALYVCQVLYLCYECMVCYVCMICCVRMYELVCTNVCMVCTNVCFVRMYVCLHVMRICAICYVVLLYVCVVK